MPCDCEVLDADAVVLDPVCDEYLCGRCGFVFGHCDPVPVDERRKIEMAMGCTRKHGELHSYKRRAHLVERLSAGTGREPAIKQEHQQLICERFCEMYADYVARHADERNYGITKRDIGRVLRSLDAQHTHRLFCVRYLEKWKTIRACVLTDGLGLPHRERFMSEDLVVRLGAAFMRLSDIWDSLQNPRQPATQWRFSRRRHFPNFNYTIWRLLHYLVPADQHETEEWTDAWPLPSAACISQIKPYVDELFQRAGFI